MMPLVIGGLRAHCRLFRAGSLRCRRYRPLRSRASRDSLLPTGGLVAPAHTPDAVIARLNAETAAVLRQREMLERLALDGSEPFPGSPAEFAAFMRGEQTNWRVVVQAIGLQVE